ncbi:MAG: MFS transporter [Caulobacterales bacterium 32-69-10]|nr:MAG: MFS transporter [Caulobacterales bacterium 32-69-10]
MSETVRPHGEARKGSLFGWYGDLDKPARRTLWAAIGGWGLDAMDVQIYSFVIPALIAVWGITTEQAGAVATAALLTSAVGGWIAGWLADRIGRVRTLQLAIAWFAFFTFLCGLAQTYEQLFAARALMGLGFGGEWAAGAVLLAETVPARHRGKALGSMQSAWAVGWAVAMVASTIVFSVLPQAQAWRVLFFIGVTPAIMIFFVRRLVGESEIYTASKKALAASGEKVSVLEIFKPPLLKVTVLGGLLGMGAQGGYSAIITWLPTYLKNERGLSVIGSSGYLAVLIVGSFLGYMTGAYLGDSIGRRNTFLVFAIGAIVLVIGYTMAPFGNAAMLVLGGPLGFFGAGVFAVQGAFYSEQFPTRVRGVGQGFTYNLGRALGAFIPFVVGAMATRMGLGQALGVFAAISYGVMAVAAFMLPETKGKVLEP